MAKIKQLSIHEIQKIAAGEVIERPSNIVKELIENSLDAQSTEISLSILDGGKGLIKIIDNGIGMSAEDAKLCIKHHTTSKIEKFEDLQNINTFGFRGEALSSISSVSCITLVTKENHELIGKSLTINNGDIIKESQVASNTGTSIEITNLFDNVPARKKFLKSTQTEYRSISQLFYAYCLANHNISFKFFSENKQLLNCPKTDLLKTRLEQIFESNLTEELIYLEKNTQNNIEISGAISNPSYTRYDRNSIYLFVNNRWVKNYKIIQAIIKGYHKILPTGKFPAAFIFINLPPEQIDINIHPRKEEVQFLHPVILERFVEQIIYKSLEDYHSQRINPAILENIKNKKFELNNYSLNKNLIDQNNYFSDQEQVNSLSANNLDNISNSDKAKFYNIIEQNLNQSSNQNSSQDFRADNFQEIIFPVNANLESTHISGQNNLLKLDNITAQPNLENINIAKNIFGESIKIEQMPIYNTSQKTELNFQLIGQARLTYIIIETSQGLVIIDQHAAHERIIYEKIKREFNNLETSPILFGHPINLSKLDCDILLENSDILEEFGISIEKIGPTSLRITRLPLIIKRESSEEILKQFASTFLDAPKTQTDKAEFKKLLSEKIHAQISCKTAVKAGDKLSSESMRQIVIDLYELDNKLTCPHGRPTIWSLSLVDIEKKFKRNYK